MRLPEPRDLVAYARQTGIPPEDLKEAFDLEYRFHQAILAEADSEIRRRMYAEIYAKVLPIYARNRSGAAVAVDKQPIVRRFRRELIGRSILDVGCGDGAFLKTVAVSVDTGPLIGIDIAAQQTSATHLPIRFLRRDIICFRLDRPVDVVFSDNVMEHIAPADISAHMASVWHALKPGGLLILIMPNRLFGPGDVSRIFDNSLTGRFPALGTHLREWSYGELLPLLTGQGFDELRTVLPLARTPGPMCDVRLPASLLVAMERSRPFLRLLRRSSWLARLLVRLRICLICRRSASDSRNAFVDKEGQARAG